MRSTFYRHLVSANILIQVRRRGVDLCLCYAFRLHDINIVQTACVNSGNLKRMQEHSAMTPAHSVEASHKCDFWGCAKRQPTQRLVICLFVDVGRFKGHRA